MTPSMLFHKTKTNSRLGTYEHKEDEVLALMANKCYIEHDVNMTGD